MYNWLKRNRKFFGIALLTTFLYLISHEVLMNSIIKTIGFGFGLSLILFLGFFLGIDQVKDWEYKQSNHWIEYKNKLQRRRRRQQCLKNKE